MGNVSARDAYRVLTAINKLRLLKMPTRQFLQRMAGPRADIRTLAISCKYRKSESLLPHLGTTQAYSFRF